MPVMDGFTWVLRFRKWENGVGGRHQRQYIAGMTANTGKEDMRRGHEVGMNCIFPKPLNKDSLLGIAAALHCVSTYEHRPPA